MVSSAGEKQNCSMNEVDELFVLLRCEKRSITKFFTNFLRCLSSQFGAKRFMTPGTTLHRCVVCSSLCGPKLKLETCILTILSFFLLDHKEKFFFCVWKREINISILIIFGFVSGQSQSALATFPLNRSSCKCFSFLRSHAERVCSQLSGLRTKGLS